MPTDEEDPGPFPTYEDRVTDPECRRMRKASGAVDDDRSLVAFLYLLARDGLSLGEVEKLVDEAGRAGGGQFTNGWLAQWAQDAAARLGAK